MMNEAPDDLLYTRDHEWIRKEDDGIFVVGITYHAQESLGDVTFVELPTVGQSFERNAVFGVIESVKAASDLLMPVTGEVVASNQDLNDSPEKVNEDPYRAGWLIKIKPDADSSEEELLNASAYVAETA
jgi:glycine cleavage system H protein